MTANCTLPTAHAASHPSPVIHHPISPAIGSITPKHRGLHHWWNHAKPRHKATVKAIIAIPCVGVPAIHFMPSGGAGIIGSHASVMVPEPESIWAFGLGVLLILILRARSV